MRAARELVDRCSRRAHLRRQHRVRPLRVRAHPGGAGGGAPAAPAAQPRVRRRGAVSRRRRSRGDAPARERAREGLLGRARRDRRAARRVPEPRRPARSCRRAARSARAAISRRSRTSRSRSSGRARPSSRASGWTGADALRRGRARADPAREQGGALARQRDAVHGGDGRARRRARAQRLAATADLRVRALARGAAGVADELRARRAPLASAQGPAGGGGERLAPARGLGDHRVAPLVRQGAGRVLAPLRAAGARRLPRPPRLRRGDRRGRAQRGDRQPARARRRGRDRLGRELPRPAAGLRARRARDGGRRAREHLGAAHRAAGQSDASPTGCRRSSSRRAASTPGS